MHIGHCSSSVLPSLLFKWTTQVPDTKIYREQSSTGNIWPLGLAFKYLAAFNQLRVSHLTTTPELTILNMHSGPQISFNMILFHFYPCLCWIRQKFLKRLLGNSSGMSFSWAKGLCTVNSQILIICLKHLIYPKVTNSSQLHPEKKKIK